MVRKGKHSEVNRARRHFIGLAAAVGARIATLGALAGIALPNSAEAKWKPWLGIGKLGLGNANGQGKGGRPMCLLRGTAILTPTGEVCIEDLRIGDIVRTVHGEARPVKWIGRHLYRRSGRRWNEDILPIRISRYAIDGHSPHRELYLSPGHALFIDGVLMRATDLVNGTSIAPTRMDDRDSIEYFQIMLDTHDVIFAEGAPVETFLLEERNFERFANFAEFARLYPADQDATMAPFAPIVGCGGREHLKALLRLATGHRVRPRSALQDTYEKIAARSEKIFC